MAAAAAAERKADAPTYKGLREVAGRDDEPEVRAAAAEAISKIEGK